MVSERSLRSFEEIISSFAYRGGGAGAASGAAVARVSNSKPVDGKRKSIGGSSCRPPRAPSTPPSLPQKKRRRSRQKEEETPPGPGKDPILSSSSSSSSYIRATIGGETVVLSKYFPLPPTACNPVPIPKKEIERVWKRRSRESDPMSEAKAANRKAGLPKKKRAASPSPAESTASARKSGQDDDYLEPQQQQQDKAKKKRTNAHLSTAEKKNEAYRRVSEDNTWVPPRSCFNLLQERYYSNPWRVLVICMLLNLTTGRQVRRVLPSLFLLCPDVETTTKVPEEDIERVIETLGLHRKRARMIKRFSQEYMGDEWTHVTHLHGVGKYAADAYAIFCAGKPEAVTPQDHKLIDYWRFACGKEDTDDSGAIKQNHQLSVTSGDDSVA